ncbi:alpha-crystallin B chain-like [Agrilus planipennis]|uniref:Alpha-crystallin B chain-like n=1 Tax=Agrilus planipennis TaxID=224129 RepID=A0A1W4WGL0_AGRPL|nr:alpha-crystallin B chain-like [Agrilus planipennis]
MSLLPRYVMRELMRPLRQLEQQMRVFDDIFYGPPSAFSRFPRVGAGFVEEPEQIVHDKDKFQVKLDVQNFAPEEIKVKSINGRSIVIEGKHEEEQAGKGFISRHFVRKFVLPEGHDVKDVTTKLSSDGVLTIVAPRKGIAEQVRELPIDFTGPEKEKEKIEKGAENKEKATSTS